MKLGFSTLALAAALFCAAPGYADETLNENAVDPVELLDEAWRLTARSYYDKRKLRQKGWSAIGQRYRRLAKDVMGPEEAHNLINRMLGELKTSHLALVEGPVFERFLMNEFSNEKTPRLGMELAEIDGELYVGGMLEGGPAELAGLHIGDKILRIDGLPALDAENLLGAGHDPGLPSLPGYVIMVDDGDEVSLSIQRKAGAAPEAVVLTASSSNLIQGVRNSVRVIKRSGHTLGVIHLWHLMSLEIAKALREALEGPLASVDGLILDIRGRGGSQRVVSRVLSYFTGRRPIWRRPVVVLQDRETRSAKEIFAWSWKRRRRGPVVGETSRGACIGTIFRRLKDGSAMLLPAMGVGRLTGGEEIEGIGIAPTIAVDPGPLPFRGGRDPILARGTKALLKLLPSSRRSLKRRPTRQRSGARLH